MNSYSFYVRNYSYFGIQTSSFNRLIGINQLKIRQLRGSNFLSDTL